jgi:hypothetical protein
MTRCTCTLLWKKTARQFVDFLKRVDRRYDDKDAQNFFLVLDNLSAHKSKMII